MYENTLINEERKAVLAFSYDSDDEKKEHSLSELEGLCEAGGYKSIAFITQKTDLPDRAFLFGTGKLQELKLLSEETDADIIIFNNQLSPLQLSNISHEMRIPVIDRTFLILEIFSKRAHSREAILQTEYARLKYSLPRIQGLRQNLSRNRGSQGFKSRGPGEKQSELDRRHIEKRLSVLRLELKDLQKDRALRRMKRNSSFIPLVALTGYTNSGKSSIMNSILKMSENTDPEKEVHSKDMVFETLDTSVRRINIKGKKPFLLSDTVGFIQDLPHDLIEAFHSTLEETISADLIIIVTDCSSEKSDEMLKVTESVLKSIGCSDNILYVMNKADKTDKKYPLISNNTIYMSALDDSVKDLINVIEDKLSENYLLSDLLIPYNEGSLLPFLKEGSNILSEEYTENGICIKAELNERLIRKFRDYLVFPN